ncbi:MFS transporter [Thiotrichales bacterium 19X7-9]|nr:MFS transporter [Thiotrichales bacterium 19X7-9]
MKEKISLYIILSVCVLTPMANNIFIASLSEMATVFNTSHIQWSMSIFLIGLAIPQLFSGLLSDYFGRKPVLIISLVIFSLASMLVPLSNDFLTLLTLRFIQALGASSLIPSAFAIARDMYNGYQLVKSISFIMLIIGVLPFINPLIGAWVYYFFHWQAVFYFLCFIGFVYILVVIFVYKETCTFETQINQQHLFKKYYHLCSNELFLAFTIINTCAYAILFAFMAVAIQLFEKQGSFSFIYSSHIIAINAITIILMSSLSPMMVLKVGLSHWLVVGVLLLLIGGVCFLSTSFWYYHSNPMMITSMLIISTGIGIIRPVASAFAMQSVKAHQNGLAAAVYNGFAFIGGAFSTWIIGLFNQITSFEFSLITIVLASIAMWVVCRIYFTSMIKQLLKITP